MLAAENPVLIFITRIFTPDPFQGIYKPNSFDLFVLVPYFTILIILAILGVHRYYMMYLYYRNRTPRLSPIQDVPVPLGKFSDLPRVTIQLPIFNERYVAERMIEEACKIEYPSERLDIQVLDDSTDETAALARDCVERYAALGHPITYLHRTNREGYKAGALAEGLLQAKGEFVAIFDADFLPPADFLARTIDHFTDPKVALVQTRWTYLNRHFSWLTEVQAILLDGHFVYEHIARTKTGRFFNFNGTAGIWRRVAIDQAGGWEHDTLTEDADLSYRAQLLGWKFVYRPDIECLSELPVEMNAFKTQQARWAKGLIQVGMKILPRVLRSDAPRHVKTEAFYHMTANLSYPLMIVLALLSFPAMIIRFYQGWFQMLYIDLPLMAAATLSVSAFYMGSQRELFPDDWKRSFRYLPLILATGVGLTLTNSWAVFEALMGKQSEFVRTPKYSLEAQRNQTGRSVGPRFFRNVYRKRAHWVAMLEVALGVYFLYTVYFAIASANYATAFFLSLFVLGYLGTGLISLFQGRWDRWSEAVTSVAASIQNAARFALRLFHRA
ncbi:MAG: glycosyltransferase [Acidobacteria bacterium]|nr:glycosyltransferase [Acidobacteriota bacterium]